jgi:hypothetical protein
MKGYCKHCQVDIFDDWQDCDCYPRPPEVVEKPKAIRTQDSRGKWHTELSVSDYNDEIARIGDIPEGGWAEIEAKMKAGRAKKGFYEGADPEPDTNLKHLTEWNETS